MVVPLGLGLLLAVSLLLRTRQLDIGYWIDEGLSVGIADRPLTDIPGVLKSHLASGKTREVDRYDQLNLAYADTKNNSYVSVAGRGEVVRDKALIDKYWNPHVSAWFPKGKDDPDTGLIKVTAEGAQYWDSTSSGMVYLWEVAKANVTGAEPKVGEARKLDL